MSETYGTNIYKDCKFKKEARMLYEMNLVNIQSDFSKDIVNKGELIINDQTLEFNNRFSFYKIRFIYINFYIHQLKLMENKIKDKNFNTLKGISPTFFMFTQCSFLISLNTWIVAMFSDGDSANFNNFLNYIEQNSKNIFCNKYYERKNVDGKEKFYDIDFDGITIKQLLEESRKGLDECKSDVEKMRIVRNKCFCHYEKKAINTQWFSEAIDDISLEQYEKVANTVECILDKLRYRFNLGGLSGTIGGIEDLLKVESFIKPYFAINKI